MEKVVTKSLYLTGFFPRLGLVFMRERFAVFGLDGFDDVLAECRAFFSEFSSLYVAGLFAPFFLVVEGPASSGWALDSVILDDCCLDGFCFDVFCLDDFCLSNFDLTASESFSVGSMSAFEWLPIRTMVKSGGMYMPFFLSLRRSKAA